MTHDTAILLLSTGTPDSANPKDVKRYLNQFLMDERVIDYPLWLREIIVKAFIVPFRYKKSARAYARIWQEAGSPLLTNTKALAALLQESLKLPTFFAMRYGTPSIQDELERIKRMQPKTICIVPLFPQYASASTGSILQEVLECLSTWQVIPSITTVGPFSDHPLFIQSCIARAREIPISEYDHVLFSFHGLPVRHIQAQDIAGCCLKKGCCDTLHEKNSYCYKAQCVTLAEKMASYLEIERYTTCFQSRLGVDDWITPYTTDVIKKRFKQGDKRLLVFSPSFVSDCLETIYEIGIEARDEFIMLGGTRLDLVPSLNTHPEWVNALSLIIKEHLPTSSQRTHEPRLVLDWEESNPTLTYS